MMLVDPARPDLSPGEQDGILFLQESAVQQ